MWQCQQRDLPTSNKWNGRDRFKKEAEIKHLQSNFIASVRFLTGSSSTEVWRNITDVCFKLPARILWKTVRRIQKVPASCLNPDLLNLELEPKRFVRMNILVHCWEDRNDSKKCNINGDKYTPGRDDSNQTSCKTFSGKWR